MYLENFDDIVKFKLDPQKFPGLTFHIYRGFTREVQTDILQYILSGNHPEIAAGAAGISPKKFAQWARMGDEGLEPFASFMTECMIAINMAGAEQMRKVLEGGKGTALSARWWLERMFPEIYGRKEAVQLPGTVNISNTQNNYLEQKPEQRFQEIQEQKKLASPAELSEFASSYYRDNIVDVEPDDEEDDSEYNFGL